MRKHQEGELKPILKIVHPSTVLKELNFKMKEIELRIKRRISEQSSVPLYGMKWQLSREQMIKK